jgi:hypothetical protein
MNEILADFEKNLASHIEKESGVYLFREKLM